MKALYILAIAAALVGCSKSVEKEHDHSEHSATESAEHGHEGHNHEGHVEDAKAKKEHGDGEITLHQEEAKAAGVISQKINPTTFNEVIKTWGRVERASSEEGIASAPVAGIVHLAKGINTGSSVGKGAVIATIDARATSGADANAAAGAVLAAAKRELARVQGLYDRRMATNAELAAAQAAYDQAKASYSPAAARGTATAPIAGTVSAILVQEGEYVNAGQAIATVSRGQGSVLRADLPQSKYSLAGSINDLVADFPGGVKVQVSTAGGRRLSAAPAGSSASGTYIPVYFTSPGAAAPAGTPFTAYLIGAKREGVMAVPNTALSEQQGNFYVYQHLHGDHYRKLPVVVGESDGLRTEIKSGIAPGTEIVVKGATVLRLSETSAVAPEGHSHEH